MKFTKMQGAGNDFIIINNIEEKIPAEKLGALAVALCERKFSIGADGLMVVEKAEHGGDYKMLFFNSDGSEAEMCGNGARCISRYGHDKGLAEGDEQHIETVSGTVIGERLSERIYKVRLNSPTFMEHGVGVTVGGEKFDVSYVELGEPGMPHAVVLLDGWDRIDDDRLHEIGREIRYFEGFPKGANVTFVMKKGNDSLKAKTYERGVEDFTLACGTGSGATVVALADRGLVSGNNVLVSVPGGELFVTVENNGEGSTDLFLTGPATMVCEGRVLNDIVAL